MRIWLNWGYYFMQWIKQFGPNKRLHGQLENEKCWTRKIHQEGGGGESICKCGMCVTKDDFQNKKSLKS